ncbi:MAG: DUF5106 domain-containing protein [Sphingobacteriales bacterium]|nr:DUF5106 domain-containing protein [Sphingobacteriales bacterium]
MGIVFFCFAASSFAAAAPMPPDGYEIKVAVRGLKDTTVLLGYHFGEKQYVKDTIRLSAKGEGVFKGETALDGGMYLIITPNKKYFEIIVDDHEQHFSVTTDTSDFVKNTQFKNSPGNDLFYEDLRFIKQKQEQSEKINAQIKEKETAKDSITVKKLKEQLTAIDNEVKEERLALRKKCPDCFFSKVLYTIEGPEIPVDLKEKWKNDSNARFYYERAHFFDNVDFSDTRLLRTSLIHQKINTYLDKMVAQTSDSLLSHVDMIIEKSKPTEKMFQYVLGTLLNKYFSSQIMGLDAVYVHISDTYYSTKQATWLSDTDLFKITDKANKLRFNLLGKPAPNMILQDDKGNMVNMYGLQYDYLLLWFWDPDCGHCKKQTPHLVAAFDTLQATYNIQVLSVCVEQEMDKWAQYLKENPNSWINVADPKFKSNFREQYDISGTPRLFILDKDKKIIGKRLNPEQLVEFLERYEKKLHTEKTDKKEDKKSGG